MNNNPNGVFYQDQTAENDVMKTSKEITQRTKKTIWRILKNLFPQNIPVMRRNRFQIKLIEKQRKSHPGT